MHDGLKNANSPTRKQKEKLMNNVEHFQYLCLIHNQCGLRNLMMIIFKDCYLITILLQRMEEDN